jgi:hypothetical protein
MILEILAYVLIATLGIGLTFFIVLLFINFENITLKVKESIEKRKLEKIGKKLFLIDKGRIANQVRIEKLAGKVDYEVRYDHLHDFCGEPLRIGLFQGLPVKWCPVCECIAEAHPSGRVNMYDNERMFDIS